MRSEEKSHHGRSTAPPSRHLWVGNLSHTLTERALSNHFRQFGELESVAFQPGRSYAFINFIDDMAAFAAIEALQGFILAGNPLRIEFTKAVSLVNPCLLHSFCMCTLFQQSNISLSLMLTNAHISNVVTNATVRVPFHVLGLAHDLSFHRAIKKEERKRKERLTTKFFQ